MNLAILRHTINLWSFTSFSLSKPTQLHLLLLLFLFMLGDCWLFQKLGRKQQQGPNDSIVTYLVFQGMIGTMCFSAIPLPNPTSIPPHLAQCGTWSLTEGHLISLSHGQIHKNPADCVRCTAYIAHMQCNLQWWESAHHGQRECCWIYLIAEK